MVARPQWSKLHTKQNIMLRLTMEFLYTNYITELNLSNAATHALARLTVHYVTGMPFETILQAGIIPTESSRQENCLSIHHLTLISYQDRERIEGQFSQLYVCSKYVTIWTDMNRSLQYGSSGLVAGVTDRSSICHDTEYFAADWNELITTVSLGCYSLHNATIALTDRGFTFTIKMRHIGCFQINKICLFSFLKKVKENSIVIDRGHQSLLITVIHQYNTAQQHNVSEQ